MATNEEENSKSTNPALDPDNPKPEKPGLEFAQFGAGCFWGVELAFQRVPGVVKTEVGYSQGHVDNPDYKMVCTGTTKHAEVIRLQFDPDVCNYTTLLALFWSRHDPTSLNRQGGDVGEQYRSGVYYYTEEQATLARESLQVKEEELNGKKIVTEILPAKRFYRAEEYHQQYLEKGGGQGCKQSAAKGCNDPIRCYGCYEAHASFSGQAAYNDWCMSLYNVFFTSLPVIAMGVFDQDVSAKYCLKFPLLYQEGVQNVLFSWRRIIGWMLNGVCAAVIIFFLCIRALDPQAFKKDGKTAGLDIVGSTIYTCVVWVVNCQMAISITYFTLIQHIFIWGGICLWYCFLLAYGAMSPSISTTAYKVFTEALAPSASYWLITLCVVIAALTPYFSYKSIQMRFFPMYHGMIQWIRHDGHSDDPEYCNMVRQRSIRHTTVGIMARSLARTNPLTGSTHRQR